MISFNLSKYHKGTLDKCIICATKTLPKVYECNKTQSKKGFRKDKAKSY